MRGDPNERPERRPLPAVSPTNEAKQSRQAGKPVSAHHTTTIRQRQLAEHHNRHCQVSFKSVLPLLPSSSCRLLSLAARVLLTDPATLIISIREWMVLYQGEESRPSSNQRNTRRKFNFCPVEHHFNIFRQSGPYRNAYMQGIPVS